MRLPVAILGACLAIAPLPAGAQWIEDGNPVTTSPGDQFSVTAERSTSNCNGSLVWVDSRDVATSGFDIYYESGDPVCSAAGDQSAPSTSFVSCSCDGLWFCNPDPNQRPALMAAWQDGRGSSSDIYAQKIQSVPKWTIDGVPVCTVSGDQTAPVTCGDHSSGGLLVAWIDERAGVGQRDIYAQKLDRDGNLLWVSSGVAVCTHAADQSDARALTDGAGGLFVLWTDDRAGPPALFIQHVQANGAIAPGWPADGLRVCDHPAAQTDARWALALGMNLLVVWKDDRSHPLGDVVATLLTPSGARAPGWPAEGKVLCAATGRQTPVEVVGGGNTAYVVWEDGRNVVEGEISPNVDVYATRITSSGALASGWVADGTPVTTRPFEQSHVVASPRGIEGIIVAWSEPAGGTGPTDIYAQALDPLGQVALFWPAAGLLLCDSPGDQTARIAYMNWGSGGGGAFIAWEDARDAEATGIDLYRTYVGYSGYTTDVPHVLPARLQLGNPHPNPARGGVSFTLDLGESRHVLAAVVDAAGREIARVYDGLRPAGRFELIWDGRSSRGGRASGGVYFLHVQAGEERISRRFVYLR